MKVSVARFLLIFPLSTTSLYAQAAPTPTASPTASPILSPTTTPTATPAEKTDLGRKVSDLYNEIGLGKANLAYEVFKETVIGYYNIKTSFDIKKPIVSIADFDKPSTEKRLWVIDLGNKVLLQNCLVAHGKQTGANMAVNFRNDPKSSKSSLGFYVTKGTYNGKNGYSLQLDGIDEGYNTNALKRAIVVHGAAYVSDDFAKTYGRLGRSWGCPAVPLGLSRQIIDEISQGSVLFIHKSDAGYQSKYLDEESASAIFNKEEPLRLN